MAKFETTVIVDGQLYLPGDEIPDFGSIKCVDTSEPRKYIGNSKDASILNDVIAKYASNKSSCLMIDTGEYYEFDSSLNKFVVQESISTINEPADKIYGVLMKYIKQLGDKFEQVSSPVIFRGSVKNAELLPSSPLTGDMYNIEEKSIYGGAGMNVAWNGVAWDPLGSVTEITDEQLQDAIGNYLTQNPITPTLTDDGTLIF